MAATADHPQPAGHLVDDGKNARTDSVATHNARSAPNQHRFPEHQSRPFGTTPEQATIKETRTSGSRPRLPNAMSYHKVIPPEKMKHHSTKRSNPHKALYLRRPTRTISRTGDRQSLAVIEIIEHDTAGSAGKTWRLADRTQPTEPVDADAPPIRQIFDRSTTGSGGPTVARSRPS